ncbi:RidA family protein [Sphingopyxis sp.]|jgi:enamine deaminase RidA (YjgF/YER057c/UK114 family)|uniref:RidA family protein n=1 Tax=Sphingopyxis sp. TaxID=1908224 RepID=UPI002DF4CCCF|nr:RidA family protein [Sphingopyxis sp.]
MNSEKLKKQSFNPSGTEQVADLYGLSQAMRVGDTIWLSGQVGADGAMTVAEGLEAQTRLAFENVKTALEAAGATMADIVNITLYLTDVSDDDTEAFMRVKNEFITAPFPALTAVWVTRLATLELLLEMQVVAVVGSGQA